MLEALHNCIAHQDYSKYSRIIVVEHHDKLEFVNAGSFYEGTPDEYAMGGRMPRQYRNPTLVNAMTNLNMIDHLGYGIEKMNRSQASRYLPLTEYDLTKLDEVRLTIYGSVVDEGYTRLLMQYSDLPFDEILALDRIQKKRPVPDDAYRRLRRKKLVEGRMPNVKVSADVASATGTEADYLKDSDEYRMALVTDYLKKNGTASRMELDRVLYPCLPDSLSEDQKRYKIGNLLKKMKKQRLRKNRKRDRQAVLPRPRFP